MSRVTTAAAGRLAGAAGLDAPTAQGRFRRAIPLAIPTGGAAQAASLAGVPVLRASFLPREVEATAPGAPEPAALTAGAAGLVLTLPLARKVARVRLAAPQPGDGIAAFRFDGAAVSDDPAAVAAHGIGGAQLGVTDRALILRRRNGGDHALAPGSVAGVVLRYAPVNPRILLAVAGDPAGEQPLPPPTGAGGTPDFPAVTERGGDLAPVLQAALDRLSDAGPLPDPLALDLVLEADQPCMARLDALDIALRLERRGFADGPGKRVLRFGGGGRRVQGLALLLPPGAGDVDGSIRVSVSGGTARAAATGEASAPAALADGVAVRAGAAVAGRLDLPAAAVVVGAELVLAAAEPQAVVRARLQADREGRPDTVLAEGGEVALASAMPVPVTVAFPATVVPAGPVWLTLATARGATVAMLGAGGAILVRTGGPDFAPLPAAEGRDLAAALRFAAPAAEPAPGLALRLGGRALPVADGVADLTAALASASPPLLLEVSADPGTVVTLDPPVLRYSLAP